MSLDTLMGGIASLAWLLFFGLLAYSVLRAGRGESTKGNTTQIVIVLVVALVLSILAQSIVFIEPNERGVVISAVPGQQGVRSEPLTPGLNFIVPVLDRVERYSISRQTYTMSIANLEGELLGDDSVEARTSDGQVVKVDATVIFAIDPNNVINVHIDWQETYRDGLIRTVSRGVIRTAVSKFGVEEVYSSRRQELTNDIQESLSEQLAREGFVLVDFVLRNIAFSDEYAASVEQKQIAEQLAQQAALTVEQRFQEAEQARQQAQGEADAAVINAEGRAQSLIIQAQAEAEARLIQAEAEAQALQLLGQAIRTNPDVLTLEYIQKLAPNIQVMLLPSDNPFLLPLPDSVFP